jgi:3-deoxy-D-manno-octulosonic-acid transferase
VVFIYTLFIHLYVFAARFASLWNGKARQWVKGRKDLFTDLRKQVGKTGRVIWVHCASAGELEQGKPIIEGLKEKYPSHKILLSFFSPSGYTVGKKYKAADLVTYLPADTPGKARLFIGIAKPELAVFIKYEYWYHHLATAAAKGIPVLLASAIFRKEQVFFRWYGGFYKKILSLFSHIFVQDATSLELLKANNVDNSSICGDTRFDRVSRIAANFMPVPVMEIFKTEQDLMIAGSTWPQDEELLFKGLKDFKGKLVLAPHEITEKHISGIEKLFPNALRYSKVEALFGEAPSKRNESPLWQNLEEQHKEQVSQLLVKAAVLIIDNVGLLSRLYYYGSYCYIGGGFNKSGIHNTLEAAVYGKPVFFGPNYQKFREARELVELKAGFTVSNGNELQEKINEFLGNRELFEQTGIRAKEYVAGNRGATEKFLQYVQANRLLTS